MLYVIIGLYLALLLLGAFFADGLIFFPHRSSYKDGPEILKLTTAGGKKISAISLANPAARFTLLISHGNAEDLGDDRPWLEELHEAGFSVFAYDYEGYGTSEGTPSEKAVYEDENSAYDYLTRTLHVPPENVIIYGRSVGSGPAVHLAARVPVAGLILQSPFLSAFRVLTRVPVLPFDKFPNYKDIRQVHCPLLIMHGEADTVIPFWHGKKLYELANGPKTFLPIPGADHNDLEFVAGKTYLAALRQFAASLSEPQSSKIGLGNGRIKSR
jgi:abhydrolase domain-containing protein 17